MKSVFNNALDHISFLARRFDKHGDLSCVVMILLMELGIATHLDGFDYLIQAIRIYEEDFRLVILYGLYPSVAKHYGIKIESKNIEQSIRSAIRAAWETRDVVVWSWYFPKGKKPSSEEFIAQIARILHLWKGSCEAKKDRTDRKKEEVFNEL